MLGQRPERRVRHRLGDAHDAQLPEHRRETVGGEEALGHERRAQVLLSCRVQAAEALDVLERPQRPRGHRLGALGLRDQPIGAFPARSEAGDHHQDRQSSWNPQPNCWTGFHRLNFRRVRKGRNQAVAQLVRALGSWSEGSWVQVPPAPFIDFRSSFRGSLLVEVRSAARRPELYRDGRSLRELPAGSNALRPDHERGVMLARLPHLAQVAVSFAQRTSRSVQRVAPE